MMKCHACGVVTQHGKASRQEVGELKNRFEAFMGRGDDILDAASDRVFEFFARGQDRGGINGVFDGGVFICVDCSHYRSGYNKCIKIRGKCNRKR
jgi:hypothetical protein